MKLTNFWARLRRRRVIVDERRCVECDFCKTVNVYRSPDQCIGCLSCFYACPYEARIIVEEEVEERLIKITVDGVEYNVPAGISVKEALQQIGVEFKPPGSRG